MAYLQPSSQREDADMAKAQAHKEVFCAEQPDGGTGRIRRRRGATAVVVHVNAWRPAGVQKGRGESGVGRRSGRVPEGWGGREGRGGGRLRGRKGGNWGRLRVAE
eukprot:358672-Chlamydomonas_euryale.AAC.4